MHIFYKYLNFLLRYDNLFVLFYIFNDNIRFKIVIFLLSNVRIQKNRLNNENVVYF